MKIFTALLSKLNYLEILYFLIFVILILLKTLLDIFSIGMVPVFLTSFLSGPDSNNYMFNLIMKYVDQFNVFGISDIKYYLSLLILIIICKNLFQILLSYFLNKFSVNLSYKYYKKFFNFYSNQSYNFFLRNSIGAIIRNIDCAKFIGIVFKSYINLIVEIFLVVSLTVFLFITLKNELNLLFLILILFTILYLYYLPIKKFTQNISKIRFVVNRKFLQILNDVYLNFKNNIINQSFYSNYKNYKKIVNQFGKTNFQISFINEINKPILEIIFCILIYFIFNIFYFDEFDSASLLVNLTFIIITLLRLFPGLTNLILINQSLNQNNAFLELIISLNLENKKNNHEKIDFKNSIEFKRVSFKVSEKTILKNVSLKIYKNKTLALIGDSGAGKTTLVDLIIGILKPSSGKIIIDNNQTDYAKRNYLLNTGYLNQINKVLNQDLENIKKDKNFEQATKKAGINFNDIKNRKTLINDLTLSGGEKQRVSLSKLFMQNKKFEIYDEPFNMLDKKNKKKFLATLNKRKKDKTIIIITHDKEILKYVDYIYEIKNKRVIRKN